MKKDIYEEIRKVKAEREQKERELKNRINAAEKEKDEATEKLNKILDDEDASEDLKEAGAKFAEHAAEYADAKAAKEAATYRLEYFTAALTKLQNAPYYPEREERKAALDGIHQDIEKKKAATYSKVATMLEKSRELLGELQEEIDTGNAYIDTVLKNTGKPGSRMDTLAIAGVMRSLNNTLSIDGMKDYL